MRLQYERHDDEVSMKNFLSRIALPTVLTALVGCAATPTSIVKTPTTVRPTAVALAAPSNGAIFQVAAFHPLFEDMHARQVGDTISITISESTTAVKTAGSSGSKTGSVAITPPPVFGLIKSLGGLTAKGTTANSFTDKDAENASNTFTATISVTITEVLPNGNFVVSGEKQLALDKGVEFIRFSGVVSPATITAGNTVASSKVADARMEYRTNSQVDRASVTATLSRFFQSVSPF
jgi:flagellar L-ring protein precursor FlgH